jgi:hypothetical protein
LLQHRIEINGHRARRQAETLNRSSRPRNRLYGFQSGFNFDAVRVFFITDQVLGKIGVALTLSVS